MLQTWQQTLYTMPVVGAAISATTTALSMLSTATAKLTLPNSFFQYPGQMIRVRGAGQLSNVVTTPGTLTIDFRLGAVVAFTSGAMQMSTTAHTTLPIDFDIILTVRSIGTGTQATLMGQGKATSQCLSLTAVADSGTTPATLLMPNVTPAVGTGFDSTSTQLVDMFATFSVATSGTAITLQQLIIESLN
jgi:hypothetical protein